MPCESLTFDRGLQVPTEMLVRSRFLRWSLREVCLPPHAIPCCLRIATPSIAHVLEHDKTALAFDSNRVVLDREAGRSTREAKSKASGERCENRWSWQWRLATAQLSDVL